jgi:hypothetical protein
MTATQVFLRFIKSEYTNSDGTIDMKKYNLWRKELRCNYISCRYEYEFGHLKTKPKSKKFVDNYLVRVGATLAGFGGHFFDNSPSILSCMYGWGYPSNRSKFINRWRSFVCAHIDGKTKSPYMNKAIYTFSWKE